MAKPSINAGLDELARESNRGGASGSSPRSSGNVMPGPSAMGGSSGGIRGGGAGLGANPARNGPAPSAKGTYTPQPGSPAGGQAAVKPGNVPPSSLGGASKQILTHGRTLGAIAHLRSIGADHPHLAQHHAKATAGIAALKGKSGNMSRKEGLAGGPKFGSMGGSSSSGAVGAGIPGVGGAAPGAAPLGMGSLPDEM